MPRKNVLYICLLLLLNMSQNLSAATWTSEIVTDSSEPDVAMDAHGNSVAVWSYSDGVHSCIQASKKPYGGDWSTPVSISSNDQQANSPSVVFDKNGNATAVWRLTYGTDYWNDPSLIQAATLTAGSDDWIHIDGPLSNLQIVYYPPKLVVDSNGIFMTLWMSSVDENVLIQGAKLYPRWSSWFPVSDFGQNEVDLDSPDFALDADGNGILVFESRAENGWIVIKTTTMCSSCLFWNEEPVQISRAEIWSTTPSIKVDSQGNAVAVWDMQTPVVGIDGATFRFKDKKWTSTHFGVYDSGYSSLALTPAGKAFVVWQDWNSPEKACMYSTLDPGSTLWTTVQLSPAGQQLNSWCSIAVDEAGNALASWPNKTLGVLQAVTLPNQSQKWSEPVNLVSYDGEGYAQIALAKNSGSILYSLSNNVCLISGTKLFPKKAAKKAG